ncbi:MAG: ABC transporter ATP-binding protein [Bacteroidota bacterium]
MLEVRDIYKTYEGRPLLNGVSFRVDSGETVCLLGPSGSGKSTMLRIIAGLEAAEAGQVLWDGRDLASTPPHLRDFGVVFQDYALFPHLTAAQNVAFGLRMRNLPPDQIDTRVAEALAMVHLEGFEARRVTDLSGGEQQRVALARALAPRPRLLMFDEPLGALDRALKDQVLDELRTILHATLIPAIYVTHDQEEAFTLADRMLLLHEGRIVQAGAPADVWAEPASEWVARFLGAGNVVEGMVRSQNGGLSIKTEFGEAEVDCMGRHAPDERVPLLLRSVPAGSSMRAENGRSGMLVTARVEDVIFQREQFRVELAGGLFVYLAEAPPVGEPITVRFEVKCLDHE